MQSWVIQIDDAFDELMGLCQSQSQRWLQWHAHWICVPMPRLPRISSAPHPVFKPQLDAGVRTHSRGWLTRQSPLHPSFLQ